MSDFSSALSGASTGLTAIGTGMSVMGALTTSKAQSNASNFNANIATTNAAIAVDQGNANALASGVAAQRRIGSGIAAYGASGVRVDSGSPLDVLADSTRSAVLDQQLIKYNANLKAKSYLDTASLDSSQASNATTSGYLNAGSALINGGSRIAAMSSGSNQIPQY